MSKIANFTNFTVTGKSGVIDAVFINLIGERKITLSKPINGQVSIPVKNESTINHLGNFLASIIRTLDPDGEFLRVTIGTGRKAQNTEILREVPVNNTVRVFIKKQRDNTLIVLDAPEIQVNDIYGDKHTFPVAELGFSAVDVPADGHYTKNPLLNQIYRQAAIPAGRAHLFSAKILKAIRKLEHARKNKEHHTNQPAPWSAQFNLDPKNGTFYISSGAHGRTAYHSVMVDSDLVTSLTQI